MRSIHAIQDIQIQLFKMKVAKGECLSDVPFKKMTAEFKAELATEATHIHFNTNLQVRRVVRGGKRVWRFIDRI